MIRRAWTVGSTFLAGVILSVARTVGLEDRLLHERLSARAASKPIVTSETLRVDSVTVYPLVG